MARILPCRHVGLLHARAARSDLAARIGRHRRGDAPLARGGRRAPVTPARRPCWNPCARRDARSCSSQIAAAPTATSTLPHSASAACSPAPGAPKSFEGLEKWQIYRQICARYPKPHLMVGDRHHDQEVAVHGNIPFVGCTYGFGTADELSRADVLVSTAPRDRRGRAGTYREAARAPLALALSLVHLREPAPLRPFTPSFL